MEGHTAFVVYFTMLWPTCRGRILSLPFGVKCQGTRYDWGCKKPSEGGHIGGRWSYVDVWDLQVPLVINLASYFGRMSSGKSNMHCKDNTFI